MDVAKLVKLGWAPGGKAKLEAFVRELPAPARPVDAAESEVDAGTV